MRVHDEIGVPQVWQDNEEYVTIRKAAERFGFTPARYRQWLEDGKLKAYRREAADRPVYLRVSEIERLLALKPDDSGPRSGGPSTFSVTTYSRGDE